MNIDLASRIGGAEALINNTTVVDTSGAQALTFIFRHSATTTVAFVSGNESDLSDGTPVDSDWLIGKLAFTGDGADVVGYNGPDRYIKINLTNPVAGSSTYAFKYFLNKEPEA